MQVVEVCMVQVHVDLHVELAVWMEEFAPDMSDGKKLVGMRCLSSTFFLCGTVTLCNSGCPRTYSPPAAASRVQGF